MIQFLQNDEIDKSRWDDCISHAINGNLNSYSWYLDIVSPNWCALIEDDYEIVFPLTVSSKFGINYIRQPYFTQQLGVYYHSLHSLPSSGLVQNFLSKIPSEYKYIDINLNTSNHLEPGTGIFEMTNFELDLISDYENLSSGYQTNLQRNLKKANQNKLFLSKNVRPEDIVSLFRANRGLELTHLGDEQYKLIMHIAYESIHKGIGEIWGAYDEHNQLVAGVLWVTSHGRSIFLFSALSQNGKTLNAMPWIIDTFVRQNAGKPITLDFEGSNDEGLARFYSSFGANRVIYHRYVYNRLPMPLRIALKIWRLSRDLLKK